MVVVNFVTIGLIALSFAQVRYSSLSQELWYRYGSLGLLVVGAIAPAVLILVRTPRSRSGMALLTAWVIAIFFVSWIYAMYSSGGM